METKQGTAKVFDRTRHDFRLAAVGFGLLAAGIAMPLLLNVESFRIYETLNKAINQWEKVYVLLAALKMALLNVLRAVPHYLGVFLIVEALNIRRTGWGTLLSASLTIVSILFTYRMIEALFGIHYDVGVPAISMMMTVITFSKIRFDFINLGKKVLLLLMIIASCQFLDIMPLPYGIPIGRGEACIDIKLAAHLLKASGFLQGMALICMAVFLFIALLLLLLITDANNIRRISEQKEQNERALNETRIRILENRAYMEVHHLVHDLKSPLTCIQALVGVIKLNYEKEGKLQEIECVEKIESNVERMSSMISEMLYEDRLTAIRTQTIITNLLSQISTASYADMLRTENACPEACVEVNAIRFQRTLINLIENSYYAITQPEGWIWLRVSEFVADEKPFVAFEVVDNGVGIEKENLSSIMQNGFSTRSSHGLGLSFVESVMQHSGGKITIESTVNEGTSVRLELPRSEQAQDPRGA